MSRLYLPFYSEQAMELLSCFTHYIERSYFLKSDEDEHHRQTVHLISGSACNGQLVLKLDIDEKLTLGSKIRARKAIVGYGYLDYQETLGSMFDKYAETIIFTKGNFNVYRKVCHNVTKEDVIAFNNWLHTGKLVGFSEKFIGSPYDPIKASAVQVWLDKAVSDVLDAAKEKSFIKRKSKIWKAKSYPLTMIHELTGRYSNNFYKVLDDRDLVELFEI